MGEVQASAELVPRPKHMERQAVDVELQMPDDCLSLSVSLSNNTSPPTLYHHHLTNNHFRHLAYYRPHTFCRAHSYQHISSAFERRRHGCFAERHDRAVQRHHRRKSQRGMLVDISVSCKLSADTRRHRHKQLSDPPTGTSKRPSACTSRQTTTLKKEMTPMPTMLSPPHHSLPHLRPPVGTRAVLPAASPRR